MTMVLTESVAGLMTTAVTVDRRAGLQQVVDAAERTGAAAVAVVDETGRLLGAVETGDHPDLFGCPGARVAGTPRQRRRRDRQRTVTARDLMTPATAVPGTWSRARAWRAVADAGAAEAFVVDELGRVVGAVRPGPGRSLLPGRDR